jgi:hypothetical protein
MFFSEILRVSSLFATHQKFFGIRHGKNGKNGENGKQFSLFSPFSPTSISLSKSIA